MAVGRAIWKAIRLPFSLAKGVGRGVSNIIHYRKELKAQAEQETGLEYSRKSSKEDLKTLRIRYKELWKERVALVRFALSKKIVRVKIRPNAKENKFKKDYHKGFFFKKDSYKGTLDGLKQKLIKRAPEQFAELEKKYSPKNSKVASHIRAKSTVTSSKHDTLQPASIERI